MLDIPDTYRAVSLTDLPAHWQDEEQYETLQSYLTNWLVQHDTLTMAVPSAIVSRSRNYLLHTQHPDFSENVRIVENEPFLIDTRLLKDAT